MPLLVIGVLQAQPGDERFTTECNSGVFYRLITHVVLLAVNS